MCKTQVPCPCSRSKQGIKGQFKEPWGGGGGGGRGGGGAVRLHTGNVSC